MAKISAEIVARIVLHQGQRLNVGDPVLAWDNHGGLSDDFQVGIFKGYDHAFGHGDQPFLVQLLRDTVHYAYVKPIPKEYLGFISLAVVSSETTDDSLPDSLREEGV